MFDRVLGQAGIRRRRIAYRNSTTLCRGGLGEGPECSLWMRLQSSDLPTSTTAHLSDTPPAAPLRPRQP